MFKPTPEHSFFIRALYKRILSEASYFFDDRARTFMINRAKRIFDEYKSCNDIHRIKVKITDARKKLHQIERANRGDKKSVMRILEAAYGRTGRIKHKLMHSYLYENIPADMVKPSPLIPHIPHTAPPPPLCYPLRTIVTKVLKKPLTPNLPTSPFKPLHRGRQANILWRYRSSLIKNITIPLPFEIGCELERKAGADIHHPSYAGQPSCQRGGPLWKDMYAGKEQTHDIEFLHLYPHAKLYPLTSPSFQRILPLPPSPFTLPHSLFATRTLVQQSPMDQTIYLTTQSKVPDRPRISYSDRKIQRFYRSLLSDIPFLHPLPTAISLYDSRIKYSLDTSQWAIGKPTKILDLDRMPESLRIQYSK